MRTQALNLIFVTLVCAGGLVAGALTGCGGGDGDGDADADGDSDGDADGEPDADADEDRDADGDAGARVFGVSVTDPWVAEEPDGELTAALDRLVGAGGRQPTVRVVFDEGVDLVFSVSGMDATDYVEVVQNIGAHARVMGELLDSFYVADYSTSQYRARACEYRATLGPLVDIWEIGNEVNGEWLGEGVVDKLAAAAEVFVADGVTFETLCEGFELHPAERPFEIALTLYYNGSYDGGVPTAGNCWELADHAMERWVEELFATPGATGTERVAPHLDYVLVSYYEHDCEGIQPDWPAVFDRLGELFPRPALGFGECGTDDTGLKLAYVERYYHGMDLDRPELANMHVAHPRFVGGYFWWYFSEDSSDEAVLGALEDALDNPFWAPGG